jgi:hypothetical protein
LVNECRQISKFRLKIESEIPITDYFLDTLSTFNSLRCLYLCVGHMKGSVKSLSGCSRLKLLNIFNLCISDFFSGVETALPNLQTLRVGIDGTIADEISDSFIDPFLTMKNIQEVSLDSSGDYYRGWFFSKQYNELKLMTNNIIVVNNNCGLIYKKYN